MAAKKISKERLRELKRLPPHMQPDWLREKLAKKQAKTEAKGHSSSRSTKTGGKKPKATRKLTMAHKALKSSRKRRVARADPA